MPDTHLRIGSRVRLIHWWGNARHVGPAGRIASWLDGREFGVRRWPAVVVQLDDGQCVPAYLYEVEEA